MTHARHGRKALGLLFLIAISLLGYMTSSAEALAWDVEGKEIGANVEFSGQAVAGTTSLLTTTAAGAKIVFHCTGLTITEGTLVAATHVAHVSIQYSGCSTKVNGVESASCAPEILPVKALITAILISLPIVHVGDTRTYFLVAPLTPGSAFTSIHFGAKCALPLITVTSSIVFECYEGKLVPADCKTSKVTQLIKPVPNQALFEKEVSKGVFQETDSAMASTQRWQIVRQKYSSKVFITLNSDITTTSCSSRARERSDRWPSVEAPDRGHEADGATATPGGVDDLAK